MSTSELVARGDLPAEAPAPPLRLVNLAKHFGGIIAVESFSLEIAAGEIVALVGDNGAGKSTLVKMISGAYKPTSGEIWLNGTNVTLKDASDARTHGVEVVYQDLALVDLQPVYMNLFLGRELVKRTAAPARPPRDGPTRPRRSSTRSTCASLRRGRASATCPVGSARPSPSAGRRTGRPASCSWTSRPRRSASPRPPRSSRSIARLRDRGAAVLLVSHNIDQVVRLADRVAVLRRGVQVGVRRISEITHNELVAMITGVA